MHFDDIETFLSVVEHTNIARAADQLNIGQGTASARIQHMEEELGIPLFIRQKGVKKVSLTPEGEYFLSIAHQWLSLWKQAQQIKNIMVFRELRIAAVDTLNQFYFTDLYKKFVSDNPHIRLYLQTEHSTEIHQLIERQQIDMGFAFNLHRSPNVEAYPLYQENHVVLYHKTSLFARTGRFSDLKPCHEIYQTFGKDYDTWHQRHFPHSDEKYISIGTFSMLPHFIDFPEAWVILPQGAADILIARNDGLTYCPLTEDPPPACRAYVLFSRYPKPWVREVSDLFLEKVLEMIQANSAFRLLYNRPSG